MGRLRKFLKLTRQDQCLLVQSTVLLWGLRLGLWLLPFQTLLRLLVRISQLDLRRAIVDTAFLDRVVWAVTVASGYIPGAKCLARALAARVLLQWRGYPTSLRIGVTKDEAGRLEAHAWLESQGRIVIGDFANLSRYKPMPPLK